MHTPSTHTPFNLILAAPFGAIGVRCDEHTLQEISYLPPRFAQFETPLSAQNALAKRVAQQLYAYFQDAHAPFDLPLAPVGTPYQQRVWAAICAIPHGSLLTYGALAKQLQSAPRAIGQACGNNWFPLIIPCHRVVASNGIGGFAHSAGEGFEREVKRWLLAHEGAHLVSAEHHSNLF